MKVDENAIPKGFSQEDWDELPDHLKQSVWSAVSQGDERDEPAPGVRKPQEPTDDSVESYQMPLIEHLRELKNRLVYALIFLVIGMGVSLVLPATSMSGLRYRF